MPDHPDLSYKAIERLRREFKRLSSMTEFQRINERAADCKADAWLRYQPLDPFCLTDYDTVADEENHDKPWVTVLGRFSDPAAIARSTRRSDKSYPQFRIIQRPTEHLAVMHANRVPVLDADLEVLPIRRPDEKRWCILCRTRHPIENFIQSKRYLNGYSYACKVSLRARQMGFKRMAS